MAAVLGEADGGQPFVSDPLVVHVPKRQGLQQNRLSNEAPPRSPNYSADLHCVIKKSMNLLCNEQAESKLHKRFVAKHYIIFVNRNITIILTYGFVKGS